MEFIPFSEKFFTQEGANGVSKEEFTRKVNEAFAKDGTLHDGYAPFCKHFFVENFSNYVVNSVPITPETEPLIKTDYVSRTENELPVLTRWIPKENIELPVAKHLDIILYSREQVKKESEDMHEEFTLSEGTQWGIVSVKPQDEAYETPMQPITIFRNALGREEGGSGVKLDHKKYAHSVAYWKDRVLVK